MSPAIGGWSLGHRRGKGTSVWEQGVMGVGLSNGVSISLNVGNLYQIKAT